MCEHRIDIESMQYHPGGTALRVETYAPTSRCRLKPKRRDIDIGRWILSGGSAVDVCHPCSGNCPIKVPAETGLYGGWAAPCPVCRTLNKLPELGDRKCRECGTVFAMVDGS